MRLWILIAFVCALSSARDSAHAEQGDDHSLRVMSYNVNFGMAGEKSTLAAIADQDADIVLLQETTPAWRRALLRKLDDRYPHVQFYHHRRAGGLAILSRYPFTTELIKSPLAMFPAWRSLVDTPIGQLQIFNLHLVPSRPQEGNWIRGYFATQSLRVEETNAYLQRLSDDLPTIVAGDFNEDITGKSMTAWQSRGLRSVLGNEHVPTWRWTFEGRDVSWQLDHILVNDKIVVDEARVIQAGASDHLPIVATLRAQTEED